METAFDRFKMAYPKREGSNPWVMARKKFDALVKSGVDPEVIIASAHRFAQQEAQRGNFGTKFIPMATTWLNQQRYADLVEHAPVAEPELHWDAILTTYKRFGRWTKHISQYGPDPESENCRVPRELLIKHGIRA